MQWWELPCQVPALLQLTSHQACCTRTPKGGRLRSQQAGGDSSRKHSLYSLSLSSGKGLILAMTNTFPKVWSLTNISVRASSSFLCVHHRGEELGKVKCRAGTGDQLLSGILAGWWESGHWHLEGSLQEYPSADSVLLLLLLLTLHIPRAL